MRAPEPADRARTTPQKAVRLREESARTLARSIGGVVALSGTVGFVTDGTRESRIANGDGLLAQVAGGAGGALAAVMSAFAAVDEDRLATTIAALAVYKVAAEIAAQQATRPGSFAVAFLDTLAALTEHDLLGADIPVVTPAAKVGETTHLWRLPDDVGHRTRRPQAVPAAPGTTTSKSRQTGGGIHRRGHRLRQTRTWLETGDIPSPTARPGTTTQLDLLADYVAHLNQPVDISGIRRLVLADTGNRTASQTVPAVLAALPVHLDRPVPRSNDDSSDTV